MSQNLLILLISVSTGLFVYSMILVKFVNERTHLRLQLKDIAETENSLRRNSDDMDFENKSFYNRVIFPGIERLSLFIGRVFPIAQKDQDKLNLQLLQAGLRIKAQTYLTIRILVIAVCMIFTYIYIGPYHLYFGFSVMMSALGGILSGYIISRFVLASRVTRRQNLLEKQLPGFLDLLSVCVEAGLGFDQAIQYVCHEYKGELSDEFKVVQRDISLGSTRKQALMSLCQRVTSSQMTTFTAAVLQADEMGISLKNILNAQSRNVRLAYKNKIEEKAQKLSTKILIPMLIFIFPVIFIILLGPAVPGIMKALGS